MDIWLALAAVAANPSISDLDWLIGDWSFHDVATEAAGFRYEEKGTRTCRWALRNQYIRCESVGGTPVSPRAYVSYINYNPAKRRFELLSMWSNHPPKVVQAGQLSADRRTLTLENEEADTDDKGAVTIPWAVIRYDGARTYIWESGKRPAASSDRGPVRFRDVVVRQTGD